MKAMKTIVGLLLILVLSPSIAQAQPVSAFNEQSAFFSPSDSLADITGSGAAFVQSGNRRIFIGTHQASALNQNPIIASSTDGVLDWVVADYETGANDGEGMGLLWDQADRLYAAFTITGNDVLNISLARFSTTGWQTFYGSGGGPRATFLLRIDPSDGQPMTGTFVIARLSNGNTNNMIPVDLEFLGNRVILRAESFFSPLRVDKERMVQDDSGTSPFDYRIMFSPDLSQALVAEAIGWDGVTAFSDLTLIFADRLEAP